MPTQYAILLKSSALSEKEIKYHHKTKRCGSTLQTYTKTPTRESRAVVKIVEFPPHSPLGRVPHNSRLATRSTQMELRPCQEPQPTGPFRATQAIAAAALHLTHLLTRIKCKMYNTTMLKIPTSNTQCALIKDTRPTRNNQHTITQYFLRGGTCDGKLDRFLTN
jgi:hypothetical protein